MAITVKHSKVSTIPDDADTSLIRPSDWNDDHQLTGTVPVANGGTGAATLTGYVKGNGTANMTAASTIPNTDITGLGTASTKDAGAALGVATLDATGKVPVSELPAAVLGALSYQGTWDASTNTPTLTSSVGTKGYYYVVSVAGSTNLNGITDWQVGDWAVYNGTVWQKVDNTDAGGDVVGPASATDNAITRFDGTTGRVIQNSVTTIDDTGNASGILSQQFSNGAAVTSAAGKIWYDGSAGSWNAGMGGGNITQQIGEELFVYGKASAAITDSPLQIIYQTGATGASGVITFAPTTAGITDGTLILGVATENLALNGFGRITSYGVVRGITTNGTAFGETWVDGDEIYYNPVTGNPTKVKPVAPNIKVSVGTLIHAGAGGSGSIQVEINHGSVLGGTDSNVQLNGVTNGQIISYDGGNGYWKNTELTAGTGISVSKSVNGVLTVTNTLPSLGGTVTSVTGTSPVVSSGGATPAISLASSYGDTQNPYASKTANFVLAAPNGAAGVPTFRAVVATDIPTLNQNTTGSAATLTTGRTIAITGDLTYTSPSFNGSANVTAAGTLATVNANVGAFTNASVTVNAKGLVTAVSSGTAPVTSVTGTAPVVSSGGATPAISMAAATTSVNGYLTSTDWTTFNNKASTALATATTAGLIELGDNTVQTVASNAVSATASRSYALQVNAAGQGVVNVPWTDTNSGGTVTSVAALTLGTTGTDLSSSVATGTTTPVITLNVPTASAANRGALSAADWTTFNGKYSVGGALGTPSSGTVTNLTGTASININGTVGATTANTGAFTTLSATGAVTLSPANLAVAISPSGTGTVTISPVGALTINPTAASTINNTSIGATTASTGRFTTVTSTIATGTAPFTVASTTQVANLNAATAGTAAGLSATLVATSGGTGQSTYAVGDLLVGGATNTLNKLADVATGNALISGGVGVAPSYGKIGLTTHVSGTLPTANGGTNLTSFTTNGLLYATSTSALTTGTALTFDGSVLSATASAAASVEGFFTNTNTGITASAGVRAIANSTGYYLLRQYGTGVTATVFGQTLANYALLLSDGASSNGLMIGSNTADPVIIGTNNAERMRIFSTGGVSVGNTTDRGAGALSVTSGTYAESTGPFFLNATTVSANFTIPTNFNATSAGPITVNTGVTVTVSTGSTWVVV
jgi:hypothetical protein